MMNRPRRPTLAYNVLDAGAFLCRGRSSRCAFWTLSALILLVMILLSGCSSFNPLPTEERHIVVLWHTFTGAEAKALQTLSDRFNAENSWNIVLITEYQEQLIDKLRAAPDTRPDLVTVWPKELQTYVAMGMVGATPAMSSEMQQDWDDVLPMAKALYEVGEVPQALPLGLATYLSYYNVDWLADLGYEASTASWEDFRRTVCAATDPERGQVGVGMPARASILMAMLAASGSDIVGEDGYFNFADDAGRATASSLNGVLSGGCGVVYEDWDVGPARLSRSSMAMILESSERLSEVQRAILAGRNFTLGLGVLPGPEGPGPTLWYGPGLMVTAPSQDRQEAALKVLHWFSTSDPQTYWGEATQYIPIRRSVIEAELEASEALDTLASEAVVWSIALAAADNDAWIAWPQPTNNMTCRASLLRGLLAFDNPEADTDAYIDAAVTACNTGVVFSPAPTPVPTETPAP
ncbi:MAG: ABC transporter substrate-binding protein [Anaerolineae bacterium]